MPARTILDVDISCEQESLGAYYRPKPLLNDLHIVTVPIRAPSLSLSVEGNKTGHRQDSDFIQLHAKVQLCSTIFA